MRQPMPATYPTVFVDFVDPACYLVNEMIGRAGAEAQFNWRGWEMCPPPSPLIDTRDQAWRAYESRAQERAARLGVRVTAATLVPWTRKAHELAQFARTKDRFHEVQRALFRARFVDQIDIGRIDLLVKIACREGLDRTETRVALDVDRFAEAVLRDRTDARALAVTTVPTLVVGSSKFCGLDAVGETERMLARDGPQAIHGCEFHNQSTE